MDWEQEKDEKNSYIYSKVKKKKLSKLISWQQNQKNKIIFKRENAE